MKTSLILFTSVSIILSLGYASTAEASSLTFLGQQNVADRAEYDVFQVGPRQGAFNALQVRAEGAPVEIKRIKIFFTNGSVQNIEKNVFLGPGNWSGFTDLKGSNRLINRVVFYYEARSPGWKSAQLKLFGLR